MDYPEIDQHGELVCIRGGSNYELMLQSVGVGNSLLIEMPPGVPSWWDSTTLAWVQKPEQPTEHHCWDVASKAWADSRSLGQVKDDRWNAVKGEREVRRQPLQVTAAGHVWDTDRTSRDLIRDALMEALIVGAGWSRVWTFADNSRGAVTVSDLQAVIIAYGGITDAVFQSASAMRDTIQAATTAEEAEAVGWD
jgi:Domain of unknown function (DUF4376)